MLLYGFKTGWIQYRSTGKKAMKLSEPLLLKLSKKYEASSMLKMKYKGLDVSFKTDHEGNPVLLFIGKILPNGKIKGERYTRTLKRHPDGSVIKDHWDLKGKAN
jgi:hypothetical protein